MSDPATVSQPSLYELDETAWLEQTAQLISQQRFDEVDCENLIEYLRDMAKRDRREVYSRLLVLFTHLLKWEYRPHERSGSWRRTVLTQRSDLRQLLESAVLRRHAQEVLQRVYQDAVGVAAAETGLPEERFPSDCFMSLDEVLNQELELS